MDYNTEEFFDKIESILGRTGLDVDHAALRTQDERSLIKEFIKPDEPEKLFVDFTNGLRATINWASVRRTGNVYRDMFGPFVSYNQIDDYGTWLWRPLHAHNCFNQFVTWLRDGKQFDAKKEIYFVKIFNEMILGKYQPLNLGEVVLTSFKNDGKWLSKFNDFEIIINLGKLASAFLRECDSFEKIVDYPISDLSAPEKYDDTTIFVLSDSKSSLELCHRKGSGGSLFENEIIVRSENNAIDFKKFSVLKMDNPERFERLRNKIINFGNLFFKNFREFIICSKNRLSGNSCRVEDDCLSRFSNLFR
jgi:hypothetical protein